MKYIVTKEDVGSRLDIFLAFVQNEYSRSHVKRQINNNSVKINGQIQYKANYKVQEGDVVEIEFAPIHNPTLVPEKMDLDIVYEDDDLIVINKQAGIVVHPATGNWEGTLMNGLLYYYQNLKNVGNNIRSGLIHRLDKDTSGLILIGKTNKGLWYYSKQFAERKVHKIYLAIVSGDITKVMTNNKIVIKNHIARHPVKRKKFAVVSSDNGKYAETEIKFIRHIYIENKKYSMIAASPKTGRTHQIRVHLSSLNYNILGDPIYSNLSYCRLMLHAWKIKIAALDGDIHKFETKIPIEFKKLIK